MGKKLLICVSKQLHFSFRLFINVRICEKLGFLDTAKHDSGGMTELLECQLLPSQVRALKTFGTLFFNFAYFWYSYILMLRQRQYLNKNQQNYLTIIL